MRKAGALRIEPRRPNNDLWQFRDVCRCPARGRARCRRRVPAVALAGENADRDDRCKADRARDAAEARRFRCEHVFVLLELRTVDRTAFARFGACNAAVTRALRGTLPNPCAEEYARGGELFVGGSNMK